jgi:hypothetical protein
MFSTQEQAFIKIQVVLDKLHINAMWRQCSVVLYCGTSDAGIQNYYSQYERKAAH